MFEELLGPLIKECFVGMIFSDYFSNSTPITNIDTNVERVGEGFWHVVVLSSSSCEPNGGKTFVRVTPSGLGYCPPRPL